MNSVRRRTVGRYLVTWAGFSLLWSACGEEPQRDIEGQSQVVIQIIATTPSPLQFPQGPDGGTAAALGAFVDPYADLAKGLLLIRKCDAGPQEPLEVPFTFTTPRYGGVGTFGVEFMLYTDCDPGDYPFLFSVVDVSGRLSNQVAMRYTITAGR